MGGSGSKQSNGCHRVTNVEKSELKATFKLLIELANIPYKTSFTYDALKEFLADKVNCDIVNQLYNAMKAQSKNQENENIDEQCFTVALSLILNGTILDQAILFCNSQTNDRNQLIKIVEGYVSSYFKIVKENDQIPTSMSSLRDESIQSFTQYLLHDLFYPGIALKNRAEADLSKQTFSECEFESWLMKCPLVGAIVSKVISCHFKISSNVEVGKQNHKIPNFIFPQGPIKYSLLNIPSVLMLNSSVPNESQNEWHLLFSTVTDGESFSTFVKCIVQEGPTIVVIKDKAGHIFGGFASDSWQFNANFTGKNNCFLFQIFPKFGVYGATGYNDHYLYINQNQQTLPNGLGMGGQMNYFGLWIDSNFGSGKCSLTCTTYENPMLSEAEEFEIDAIEVWRVGPRPKTSEDEDNEESKKSILDKDLEAKAMLMLAGRTQHSEGLREGDPTADSPDEKIIPPLI